MELLNAGRKYYRDAWETLIAGVSKYLAVEDPWRDRKKAFSDRSSPIPSSSETWI